MSVWLLLQIAFNIFLFLAVWMLWTKFRRPPKDDPRLSRGLQLLQSKISVLEDLSDRTDNQVKQLSSLLERKCREVQNKIEEASSQMIKIDQSVAKSLDVASIFEDRIPHQEIIERQRTRAYVKAAKLAHQGLDIEEIAEKVDLSRGELEMIVKVNRDRLMFSEEELPAWARSNENEESSLEGTQRIQFQLGDQSFEDSDSYVDDEDEMPRFDADLGKVLSPPVEAPKSLEKIGAEFRKVCQEMREQEELIEVESKTETLVQQLSASAVNKLRKISQNARDRIQEFSLLEEEAAADLEAVAEPKIEKVEPVIINKKPTVSNPDSLKAASQAVKTEIQKSANAPVSATPAKSAPAKNLATKDPIKDKGAQKVAFKIGNSTNVNKEKTPVKSASQQQAVLQATGTKMVDSSQIKKVKFPRIDMNSGLG